LFVGYAMAQALNIIAFVLVPTTGWTHVVWQMLTGAAGAVFVVVGVRRARIEGALPWYLFAASTFLCASGVLVEAALDHFLGITESPNLADLFWLALYPGLLGGLASLVYKRSAGQSAGAIMGSTLMSALFTIGVGLFAWESIVWRADGQSIDLWKRLIVTAYPLGDLAVLAFVLRLLFGAGSRSLAFGLIVLSIACHLGADIAWAYFLRSNTEPDATVRQILEATSLAAHALMGAAALHHSMSEVALSPVAAGEERRTSSVAWIALAVSASAAPALVALETILDHLYHVSGN
jgi:hypothetical protein